MMCLACRGVGRDDVCEGCRRGLFEGAERLCSFGIVRSAYLHEATARILVHRLKYEAIRRAGGFLARALVDLVPGDARCLVPIPRSWWRAARFGVDPAAVLVDELSRLTALPVAVGLRATPFSAHHAGRSRDQRSIPRFVASRPIPEGAVLVDDVVTTGLTLESASRFSSGHIIGAVTATVSV